MVGRRKYVMSAARYIWNLNLQPEVDTMSARSKPQAMHEHALSGITGDATIFFAPCPAYL